VLRSLSVRNLAVVASGRLELAPGFNVLTGETGAGKSLVVDSLALLAGARADDELIRAGSDSLEVTGLFARSPEVDRRLAASGIEIDDDEVVVRREINREGRNRVFVNDRPATVRLLQELAPSLLRIHGQREELGLADPELQRAWLDRAGGTEAQRLLGACGRRYDEYRGLAERLERLDGDQRLRRERIDLLRFQVSEIDAARLAEGEEESLRAERDALRHAEAIVHALGVAYGRLSEDEGAALESVEVARRELDAVSAWEELARQLEPELAEVETRIGEAARALSARLGSFDVEPGRLDEIESRLAALERLFKKYGGSSAAVLALRSELGRQLEESEGDESNRDQLETETGRALDAYRTAALELSQARHAWARELSGKINEELGELALGKARIEVGIERQARPSSPLVVGGEACEFGASGFDQVVFRFAPNPGEPMLPLVKIASGGELARVALALQLATRGDETEGGPTLVFDEIDAGLGGAQGAAVGRKLRRLARRGQILAVTHLPQVASYGDRHHRVTKSERDGRTLVEVEVLPTAPRLEELARMLSGAKVTALARRHAEEMLDRAQKEKR